MAGRKVVWTQIAETELQEILEFFLNRNRSNAYSLKLYRKFTAELKLVAKNPGIGIKTKLPSIRGLIIEDYIIFYEILTDKIMVLQLWDCRQNPDKFTIREL